MKTKTPGPVEDFLDDICQPNRQAARDAEYAAIEMNERRWEGIREQDLARREEAIWDDMKCTPAHWEQRTRDVVEQVDLERVYAYIANQINRLHVAQMCAIAKHMDDDVLGEEFLKHLTDECNQETISRLIKAAVQQAIDEEVSK